MVPIPLLTMTVFLYNLSPSPLLFTSWHPSLHAAYIFFSQTLSSFQNTRPYQLNIFAVLQYQYYNEQNIRFSYTCLHAYDVKLLLK